MIYGYARVSTQDQDTDLQLDALQDAGVATKNIYQEKASGARSDRPVLAQCLNQLKRGDVLIVWKIDRIARSLKDLLHILECIQLRGATIKSLTEPLDTTSSMGMFVLQILGAVAQLERSLIRERSIAGQRAAIARGVRVGRALSVDRHTAERIVADYLCGGGTLKGVSMRYGVSASVVKRLVYKKTKPTYRG
jgi:DNA invertase Pin-like site-specific DNA recombinase